MWCNLNYTKIVLVPLNKDGVIPKKYNEFLFYNLCTIKCVCLMWCNLKYTKIVLEPMNKDSVITKNLTMNFSLLNISFPLHKDGVIPKNCIQK